MGLDPVLLGQHHHAGRYVAEPMAADDVEWAAALHSQAFSQPWSGDEFASLLSQNGTFGFVVRRTGQVGRSASSSSAPLPTRRRS